MSSTSSRGAAPGEDLPRRRIAPVDLFPGSGPDVSGGPGPPGRPSLSAARPQRCPPRPSRGSKTVKCSRAARARSPPLIRPSRDLRRALQVQQDRNIMAIRREGFQDKRRVLPGQAKKGRGAAGPAVANCRDSGRLPTASGAAPPSQRSGLRSQCFAVEQLSPDLSLLLSPPAVGTESRSFGTSRSARAAAAANPPGCSSAQLLPSRLGQVRSRIHLSAAQGWPSIAAHHDPRTHPNARCRAVHGAWALQPS
jgi:hypothetical protein